MSAPRGSGGWRARQERDPFVRQARREGWRSRAVYKLIQIDEKEKLLGPGMVCVDLGAAPGGWSQYAAAKVGERGRVLAVDLLGMEPIAGVEFIRGDFTEDATFDAITAALGDAGVDLVLSDMAPNISGNRVVDQPRAMYLAELALDIVSRTLKPGGALVCKLFQGEGFDAYLREARTRFGRVSARKPGASRAASREVYLVARNYRMV